MTGLVQGFFVEMVENGKKHPLPRQ